MASDLIDQRLEYVAGRREGHLGCIARHLRVLEVDPEAASAPRRQDEIIAEDSTSATTALELRRKQQFDSENHILRKRPSKKVFTVQEINSTILAALETGSTPIASPALVQSLFRMRDDILSRSPSRFKRTSIIDISLDLSEGLQNATTAKAYGVLQILARRTGTTGLAKALAIAIEAEDRTGMSILLRNGADPRPHTDELRAGIRADKYDFISTLLGAPQHFEQTILNQCLMIAVQLGHAQSVAALLFNGAAASAEDGEALVVAVRKGRLDLAVALCISQSPPSDIGLKRAFTVISDQSLPFNAENLGLLEILLASGAAGDYVAKHLITACKVSGQDTLVRLLLDYGASLSFDNSEAILQSMLRSDMSLFMILLQAPLNSATSATAIARASKDLLKLDEAVRVDMFTELLSRLDHEVGHDKEAMAVALISAVEAGDVRLARYLVERGASVDYMNGKALCQAVRTESKPLLDILLHKRPQMQALTEAFTHIQRVSASNRVPFASGLLQAGAAGPAVDELLRITMSADVQARDYALIELLVTGKANVDASDCVQNAIRDADMRAVQMLLCGRLSENTLSGCIAEALNLEQRALRLDIVQALLTAGGKDAELGAALVTVVQEQTVDVELAKLLRKSGSANVDYRDGEAIRICIQTGNTKVVEILLGGEVCKSTLDIVLHNAMAVPDRTKRLLITEKILNRGAGDNALQRALVLATKCSPPDSELVQLLLSYSASINHNAGEAAKTAIGLHDMNLLRLLLSQGTATPKTLSSVLLFTVDSMRSGFDLVPIEPVLDAARGAIVETCSELLPLCVQNRASSIEFLRLLIRHGASVDYHRGEALGLAVSNRRSDILAIMMEQSPAPATFQRAFSLAFAVVGNERVSICNILLSTSKQNRAITLDAYLAKAVREVPRSRHMIELLLKNKASVHYASDQPLVDATRAADPEILKLLLERVESRQPVHRLFEEFVQVKEMWNTRKGIDCFILLLEHGAKGVSVDAALCTAVELYKSGDYIARFLNALIQYGADVEYKDGVALLKACQQGGLLLVQKLIEGGPSVESCSRSFPHFLLAAKNEETVNALLATLRSHFGVTTECTLEWSHRIPTLAPITFLCIERWPTSTLTLECLFEHGCPADEFHGQSVRPLDTTTAVTDEVSTLSWACGRASFCVVKALLVAGANVNFRVARTGNSPLFAAVAASRPEIVRLLLDHWADVSLLNTAGQSPLLIASCMGNTEIMSLILKKYRFTNDGSLHEAARNCHFEAVKMLVQYGHDLEFGSSLHQGRDVLQELALNCRHSDASVVQKVIAYLYSLLNSPPAAFDGKPLVMLALDNRKCFALQ